ncbi:unnamed protein product [Mytilus edulis]|uniref:Fibronectin type-III domain-containing protein n=1 Tax=Mytilus edulis TaxID=6550 RepID=A0A8S3TX91_MYTED|nr:unnamed protein product [Mytilus edulis]
MVSLNGAYEFTCPSQAHWNLRAKSMCKPTTNYTCLFDINLQINVYRDRCYRPSIVGPGYKYVFQPNLNRAACSSNRYQPFIFETVGYSDCTFKNHFAAALVRRLMQTVIPGNSNNQCYCNPSTEDCSCYLGNNPYNETVGLEDIKCYHEMKMTRIPYLGDMFNISRTIKINEFDNNKYNIKHLPTIVVWIIVLRIMRQLIKTRSTPREFNIIECTDCSMTIGWFIDVPDECLSYELDHRVRGTDDWSTETFLSGDVMTDEDFLSGDVMKDEDGRRMYKLQNLKPETYYEFKMRSVYKDDVKSHYSESKTKQTLKLGRERFGITFAIK